jgi:hypothetical protein
MKKLVLLIVVILNCVGVRSQIAHYNQYPTMYNEYINFAFSVRQINLEYEGPLIRLRRASDNAEQDFSPTSSGSLISTSAINTWRGSANVFVVKWYDQSGWGRDAIQTTNSRQPLFNTASSTRPYFAGDASNDYLEVQTGFQELSDSGMNGSVICVMNPTTTAQFSFGVADSLNPSDRWSIHANWSDNNVYFDPGVCCNGTRSFGNSSFVGTWKSYSFIRTKDSVIARRNGVTQMNGLHTTGRCTSNNNFRICHAGRLVGEFSDTKFMELIMYNTNIDYSIVREAEDAAISFWGL